MINKIKTILNLGNKKKLIFLQFLIIFSALLELTSLVSIIPFLGLVTDDQYIFQNSLINKFYLISNLNNTDQFIIFFGCLTLFFFLFSITIVLLTKYKLIKFSEDFAVILNNYFYKILLRKRYIFFIKNSSSYILRTLNDYTFRV